MHAAHNNQQQQPFNGHLSGTTRVGRYQRNIHPLTPILVNVLPLSPFSICNGPRHPLYSAYVLDSPLKQPLSRSSLVFPLVLNPELHTPCISSPNHHHLFAAHAHTNAACSAAISMLCHLHVITHLRIGCRGCRAGNHCRRRLLAAQHSVTSSVSCTTTCREIPTIIGHWGMFTNNNDQLFNRCRDGLTSVLVHPTIVNPTRTSSIPMSTSSHLVRPPSSPTGRVNESTASTNDYLSNYRNDTDSLGTEPDKSTPSASSPPSVCSVPSVPSSLTDPNDAVSVLDISDDPFPSQYSSCSNLSYRCNNYAWIPSNPPKPSRFCLPTVMLATIRGSLCTKIEWRVIRYV